MSDIKWNTNVVREVFIKYFEHWKHTHIHSSSVEPKDDPSLLFCNAGMNQFKPIFLGNKEITTPRACNSQKCIRAGGKHNDLDDVGKDIYHHTFFEMLGNWSFNDYWKSEAIDFAWDLLTNIYKLDKSRIYVTYFGGDESIGLNPDEECREIWTKYLPDERILPFNMKDNFWEMGNSGPCGGCTEIHYDRSDLDRDASSLVNMDDPSVLEIWNLVFMEYNRLETEDSSEYKLERLSQRFVDTGMGLERLVSILQHKESNYDTDVFSDLFETLSQLTEKRSYEGKVGNDDEDLIDTSYRIIVDHIRTVSVCLADDVIPGHQMRNNVLRQILRRAVRYGRIYLEITQPFFWKLVDPLANGLGSHFKNIAENKEKIKYIIQTEENNYMKTLNTAYKNFDKLLKKYEKNKEDTVSLKDVHDLWNTHGYPREVVERDIRNRGFKIEGDDEVVELTESGTEEGTEEGEEESEEETSKDVSKDLSKETSTSHDKSQSNIDEQSNSGENDGELKEQEAPHTDHTDDEEESNENSK